MNNQELFTNYKYIAHRGLHENNIIENSLASFINAIKYNYAIELDVRLTLDNEVIVFHDDNLKRLFNKDVKVSDLTLKEIKEFKFVNGETIPTLKETLETIKGAVPLLIELKNFKIKSYLLEKKVLAILTNYQGKFALQSFNFMSLLYLRLHSKNLLIGQLADVFTKDNPKIVNLFIKNLFFDHFVHYDFITYKIDHLPNKYIKNKNKPIISFVCKSNDDIKAMENICSSFIFEGFRP